MMPLLVFLPQARTYVSPSGYLTRWPLLSGHLYGNAVDTELSELKTEDAELDDDPELELVLAIDEVPEEPAEIARLEEDVILMMELELELELEFLGGPAEKKTAPAG